MRSHVRTLRDLVGSRCIFVPDVRALIPNRGGEILFQHHTDTRHWRLPSGALETDELALEARRRARRRNESIRPPRRQNRSSVDRCAISLWAGAGGRAEPWSVAARLQGSPDRRASPVPSDMWPHRGSSPPDRAARFVLWLPHIAGQPGNRTRPSDTRHAVSLHRSPRRRG